MPRRLLLEFKPQRDNEDNFLDFIHQQFSMIEKVSAEGLALIYYLWRKDDFFEVVWPLNLPGAVVLEDSSYKFPYIQFVLPCTQYPDERTGTPALEEIYPLKPWSIEKSSLPCGYGEVRERLDTFVKRTTLLSLIQMILMCSIQRVIESWAI